MAESLLFGRAESLLGKLASRAFEEATLVYDVHEDLRCFKNTLSIVKGVLLDAEAKQEQTHGLREWLQQIKDVFSEAEDVLDEFECEALRKRVVSEYGSPVGKVRHFLSSSNPIVFRSRMAHEIKAIRERLDGVAADGAKFGLNRIEADTGVVHRREMTYSHVIASDVIGRDHDKEKIIDLLFQTHPDIDASTGLSVVPIVGIGGMGKTTLAKLVFNDKRIDKQFPLKMWVCVSDDFDIKQLIIKIINCAPAPAGQENITNKDTELLQKQLKDRLTDKKFLLVLDDVWNDNVVKWVELRNLLQVGEESRIIVTTRSKEIAEMMGTIPFYELHGLSYQESLTMFVKWAFKEGEEKKYPNLVKIGGEIVKKCKGVPLAVRTLASSLFLKVNEEEWKSVRDNNEIWDMPQKQNDILLALKLSYDRMPSYLRQFFSFFSLYPKNFEFDSIVVTSLWTALGLIQSPNGSKKLENLAEQYLHELHSRCFLQDFMYFGYFYTFKMHDLVHDLAVYVAKDEFFMINSDIRIIPEKCRHLSIVKDVPIKDANKDWVWSYDRMSCHPRILYKHVENAHILDLFPKSKYIKTIMFPIEEVSLGQNSEVHLIKWLSRYKNLRVLDLSGSCFEVLPKFIGKLRCLRHLNLSFNRYIKKLPSSICDLQSLQTLLFKGCTSLQALPNGLEKLISLRQLAITTQQSELSGNKIAGLASLEILSFEYCPRLESLFGGIQHLTSLKELAIHECKSLIFLDFYSIIHLPELVALSIVNSPDSKLFEGHADLKITRMKLRFVRFLGLPGLISLPEWLLGAANTLHTLMICNCENFQELPDWLKTFSQFNTLQIFNCQRLVTLSSEISYFRRLPRLEIVNCPGWGKTCMLEPNDCWPVPRGESAVERHQRRRSPLY